MVIDAKTGEERVAGTCFVTVMVIVCVILIVNVLIFVTCPGVGTDPSLERSAVKKIWPALNFW